MRKFFLSAIVMAMCVTSSIAQTAHKTIAEGYTVTPGCFTYGEHVYVLSVSDDNVVTVYDEDLEFVRSFTLNFDVPASSYIVQRRKAEGKRQNVYEQETSWDGNGNPQIYTWNEAKEWMAENHPEYEVRNNFQFWPTNEYSYWKVEEFGKMYPREYFVWYPESGYLFNVVVGYSYAYTGDWETVEEGKNEGGEGDIDCVKTVLLYDYDSNSVPNRSFCFTQTMFNTDDKFEYIVPAYGASKEITSGYDRDGDGEIDHRTIWNECPEVGSRIISEDGTVLQTILCNNSNHEGYYWHMYKMCNRIYLETTSYKEDSGGYESSFYKIDPQATSITRVSTMPTSARFIYSLDGRKQSGMQRGINVVGEEDGTVKKVLWK